MIRLVALLKDLSKAFDCLDYELLIAKLNAYRLSLHVLRLIHDYLSHRKQRTRVNNSYSEWLAVIIQHFLADLFISDIDIANFADDNKPYLSVKM